MVKIRLRRVGAKKQPSYRIVVADARSPRDGRFIEAIGFYNPRTEPETVVIKEERALHWLSVGAQPTEPVLRLLKAYGTWGRFERLKAGESLESLVAEAEAAAPAAEIPSEDEEAEEPAPSEEPEEEGGETPEAETVGADEGEE